LTLLSTDELRGAFLVMRRSDGAPDAEFADWYSATSVRLTRSLGGLSGDPAAAEEAMAEAFARAYSRWPQVRRMQRRDAWVFRVALNCLRSTARKQRREVLTDGPPAECGWSPEAHDADLWAAVALLPERTRACVVLRYVADQPEQDIADVLGVTRGTVATLLSRARRDLAVRLTATDLAEECS
jgi:RNA polymerase sigma factor (sigma-70 family)